MYRPHSSSAFGQPLPLALPGSGRSDQVPHFMRVSERAYELWKNSGFTPGAELEFWYQAEQELLAEESAPAGR